MKKDAYYFSHDANARNDEKILELRIDHGYEGYGLFWGVIEVMREANEYKLTLDSVNALSLTLNYPVDKLQTFINDCINKYKLFVLKNGKYYSLRLLRSMKQVNQFSEKMRAKAMLRHNKGNALKESKGKENISFDFESVWELYPRKEGKKAAIKHFNATVKTEEDYNNLRSAIENYKNLNINTEDRFIKQGQSFFNNWQDYIPEDSHDTNSIFPNHD